jgi:GH35 family endo-1,4-beta-xylanase
MSYYVLESPEYRNFFTNHFEWAVFENETKWSEIEPTAGARDFTRPDAMVQFCVDNGIRMRGHTIYWSVQNYIQEWVQDLAASPVQLYAAMSNHIETVVPRYSEHFEHWDVNNEMLHGTFYSNVFGNAIRTRMFEKTRELDPDVSLFVNDYGVVSYSDTDHYVEQIQGLIAAGADIGGIGAQCHMWELNPYWMFNRLDKLGELNLPVWCSEFDIANPDEFVRARQLEIFYRCAFSHPAVQGILMWGFWASNHWRGADAAIVNGDWTLNAAGQKYEQLLGEWTTQTNGATAQTGVFSVRGFHGDYDVTVSVPGCEEAVQQVDLSSEVADNTCIVTLPANDSDGDGIPDAWEEQYSLNPAEPDSTIDSDGDGLNNQQEFIALTDPDDPASAPHLTTVLADDGTTMLSFDTRRARYYDLCFKTNLNDTTWCVIGARMPGTDAGMVITNATDAVSGYWSLRIVKP